MLPLTAEDVRNIPSTCVAVGMSVDSRAAVLADDHKCCHDSFHVLGFACRARCWTQHWYTHRTRQTSHTVSLEQNLWVPFLAICYDSSWSEGTGTLLTLWGVCRYLQTS